jgi:4-alpha-glucanotransferase
MNERGSGILLHISSLPSGYGIGDMGPEAYRFADKLKASGQRYWQILPLNPTNSENGDSPYFSSSAFAGNPLLISPELLVEDGFVQEEDILFAPETEQHGSEVDFESVREHRKVLLEKAFITFKEGREKPEFLDFCAANGFWLEDYALFMSLKREFKGISWGEWPVDFRDREAEALEDFLKARKGSVLEHKFYQFLFHRQWQSLKKYCNDRGITIIGDLPIYVSYDSSDVWVDPGIFKLDDDRKPSVVSGVPPDYFSETGQLWSNPVYRWDVLKKNSYKWWVERFAVNFAKYDMVRIDHFRGLVQYWEVPAGEETAVNGSWQDVPTYDFFDTLKKEFPDFPVIAEDLGIITDDVKEAKAHYDFPGMKVLIFAFGEDNPDNPYLPHNYERNCLVYTGTHDNNTLAGWYNNEAGEEDRERFWRYLGGDPRPEELNTAMIRLAMMSVADKAIMNMQDLLGLGQAARMNEPSSSSGNWRWRLEAGQMDDGCFDLLGEMTRLYGRAGNESSEETREPGTDT